MFLRGKIVNVIPCHYMRPFLDRHGDLYPCCFKNMEREYIIGNVSDENLIEKLENYSIDCQCGFHKFRAKNETDKHEKIHIQTSLQCHGKCAVCYVAAPLKHENIELHYDQAYAFLEKLAPRCIYIEGGEVPIQKNALAFVRKIKDNFSLDLLHLLTNGCYPAGMATQLADVFTAITISYMGFSKNLYYHETMLDVNTTNAFARIVHEKHGRSFFRYICTPLSIIETSLFLQYATRFQHSYITYADCDLDLYTKASPESLYWPQIIKRCRVQFREMLLRLKDRMIENQATCNLEPRTASLLDIDKQFTERFDLKNVRFL